MSTLNSTYQLSASDFFQIKTEDFLNTRAHVYTIEPKRNVLPGLTGIVDSIELYSNGWSMTVEDVHSDDPTDMFEVLVSAIGNQYNISEPSAYVPMYQDPAYVDSGAYHWGRRGTHVSYLSVSPPQVTSAIDGAAFSIMLQWPSPISGFSADTTSPEYFLPVKTITTKSLELPDSEYEMICPSGFFKEAIWTVEIRSATGTPVSAVRFSYDSSLSGAFSIDCLTGEYESGDFISDVVHTIETSAMSSSFDSLESINSSAVRFESMRISADDNSSPELKELSTWIGAVAMDAPSAFSTAGMTYDFSGNPALKNHMDMFIYAPRQEDFGVSFDGKTQAVLVNRDSSFAIESYGYNSSWYASTLLVSAMPEVHIAVNRIKESGASSAISAFDVPTENRTLLISELGSKRFGVTYSVAEPIISVGVETQLVPAWGYSTASASSWMSTISTEYGDVNVTTLFAYPTITGRRDGFESNVLTAMNRRGARCIVGGVDDGLEYGDGIERGIANGSLVPLWSVASAFKKLSVTATLAAESYIDNELNAKMFDLSYPTLSVDLSTVFPFYVLGENTFELRDVEPMVTSATSAYSGQIFAYRPSFSIERFTEDTVSIGSEYIPAGMYSIRARGKVVSVSSTAPLSAQTFDGVSVDSVTAFSAGEVFDFDGGKDIQFISTELSSNVHSWISMSSVYADVDPLSVWSATELLYQYYVPEFISVSTLALDTMGPTATWTVSALTDLDHRDVGLLDSHYIRWYADATPVSSVSSITVVSPGGDVYENGGLGGHGITVNVVPMQVAGATSRISVGLTAVLACKNSATETSIVDQPLIATDSFFFYTYPQSYMLDLGCDRKKPLSGNVVWSETFEPTINGSFSIYEANQVQYEIVYESAATPATVLTSVGAEIGTSGEFSFPTVIPADGSTVQTYTLNVTADPVGGNFSSNWNSSPRRFTRSIVNKVLSTGDLTASPICVVPTYVYNASLSAWYKNELGDVDPVFPEDRPSAYAIHHTEPFLAWATEGTVGKKIGWYIERDGVFSEVVNPENGLTGITIPVKGITDEDGIRVISKSERLFGSVRPMKDIPFRVYGLIGSEWVLSAYSCYSYTDNGNIAASAKNIAMVDPEIPDGFSIDVDPTEFVISDRVVVTATMNHDGNFLPLSVMNQSNKWTLSNGNYWDLYSTSNGVDPVYIELRSGIYESTPGHLFYGDASELSLSSMVHLAYTIVASGDWGSVSDWGVSSMFIPVSYDFGLSASARPRLDFIPKNSTASIGEDIIISNKTDTGYYLGGYRIFDGVHDVVEIPASADSYTIVSGYAAVGTYSFSVTGYRDFPFAGETVISEFQDLVRIYSFEPYTTEVERVYGHGTLSLPYGDDEVGIGPNEWVTSDNMNRCFERIFANLEYIDRMTMFYHNSPTEYSGFVGSYLEGNRNQFGYVDKNRTDINVEQADSLSGLQSTPVAIESVASDPTIDCLYLVSDGKVYVVDKKSSNSILHVIDHSVMNETVSRLKNVSIDSFGDIYVLAPEIHKVIVFNKYDRNSNTPCRYITEWGGYGGASAKLKFRNPSDLAIDSEDNVWVADTGNKAVKKYTRSGSWLLTIELPDYIGNTEKSGIIGLDVDINGNVHVLTSKSVYVYSGVGDMMSVYLVDAFDDSPRFIRKMSNAPYMYIGFATYCKKVNLSGGVVSEFGSDLQYHDFRGCFHDIYRNFYIANTKNILVYCDGILISRVSNPSYKQFMWNMEDILIDPNENVQDWVCNVAFHRMYDNIDLLRMSLFGKVEYREVDGVDKLISIDYHPDEYALLKFEPKSDIFIGTNELVTMSVINRCILKLQNCLRTLLVHI